MAFKLLSENFLKALEGMLAEMKALRRRINPCDFNFPLQ